MSKANKQQVPKIRFEGFGESWSHAKLRDGIFRLIGGISISPSDYVKKGFPTIPKGAINISGVADLSGIKYVSESFFQNNNKAVVSEGNLITCLRDLVPSGPNLARIVKIPVNDKGRQYLMPQGVYALKLRDNLIYSFLVNYSNTNGFRNIVFREKNGTTQVHIRNDDFLDIKIIYPSRNEQTQIGNFFQQLDKLIKLQTRAVESAETYKKAMLQKMFPQKGEKVPRVRFEGFGEAWQSYNLDSLVKINMGQSPDSVNYTENSEDHILVQGNADLDKGKVVPRIYTTQVTKTAEKGDIILTVRAPVGAIAITDFDVVLGRGVAGIKGNLFVYYTLELFCLAGTWLRFSSGSTFDSINSNEIKQIVVLVPSKEEQEKIGSFFQKLDQKIESEKKKLEQYQTMKRALLQRMFV